jgi:uncharacterized phage-associated protein
MTYSAKDVAKVVLLFSNEQKDSNMTNLKLQKVLYYIQAYFLTKENKPCFDDEIYAWKLGPVVQTVYFDYYMCANNNIWSNDIEEECKSAQSKFLCNDLTIIRRLVKHFYEKSAFGLVNRTHNEDPWKDTMQSCVISCDKIKAYYDVHPVIEGE